MPSTSASCPDNDAAVVGKRLHFPAHACCLRVERDPERGTLWLQKWTELSNGDFEEEGCVVDWIELEYDEGFYADVDAAFHTTFLQQRRAHEARQPDPRGGLVDAAARALAYLTNGEDCDDDPVSMLQALRSALAEALDDPCLVEHAVVTVPFGMPDWPGQPPARQAQRG